MHLSSSIKQQDSIKNCFVVVIDLTMQLLRLIVLCVLSSTTVRGAVPTTPTPWYVVSSGTRTCDLSKLKPSFLQQPKAFLQPSPPTPPQKTSVGTMESVAHGLLFGSFVSDLAQGSGFVVEPTFPVLVTNAVFFVAWKTSLLFEKLDYPAFSLLVYAGNLLWNYKRELIDECKLWKRLLNWRLVQFKHFLDERLSKFSSCDCAGACRPAQNFVGTERRDHYFRRLYALDKFLWKERQYLRDLLIAIIFSDEDK